MQLSRDEMLRAYRTMRLIRVFEDRVSLEMASGDVPGNTHLYAGQEASATGVCFNLIDTDRIASTHRGHGHSIAKGCDIDGMMAEIFGKVTGICHGKGGSMHIADLDKGMLGANGIVGGSIPIACGAALTAKTLKTGGVAVAFTGDGGVNQGTMCETLNLASIWQLPMIFIVEDNGFAEATSSAYATAGSIPKRGEAFNVPSVTVDGLDFFEVEAAMREAIERGRTGGGPSLIHITTPRYYGHFSGDADTYRTAEEKLVMRRDQDCLKRFRAKVTAASLLADSDLDAIDAEVDEAVDAAVAHARAAARPKEADLLTHVYVSYA